LASIIFLDLGGYVAGGSAPHTITVFEASASGHSSAIPPKVSCCARLLGVKHCAPPDSVQFGVPN